jgi:hypothetical protein
MTQAEHDTIRLQVATHQERKPAQPIDVARPDAPYREPTGARRLQNLGELGADVALLMEAAGTPLDKRQKLMLPLALDALIFGEQAA